MFALNKVNVNTYSQIHFVEHVEHVEDFQAAMNDSTNIKILYRELLLQLRTVSNSHYHCGAITCLF